MLNMTTPSLTVEYFPDTNTAKSVYICGATNEEVWYEGQRGDMVKFTRETWPEYLSKLYGRALPVMIDGYGWYKYIEDAEDAGIPPDILANYSLQSLNPANTSLRLSYVLYERRSFTGELLERHMIYNDDDNVWWDASTGGTEMPVDASVEEIHNAAVAVAADVISKIRAERGIDPATL